MTQRFKQRIAACCVAVALVITTPTIYDRILLIRFNHAIADVRNADIHLIRFKPHVDREFVTISDPAVLRRIQEWIGTSKAPKALYSYPPTTCPFEITLADGKVKRVDISPTGLTATYIVEIDPDRSFERQHQITYVMLSHEGRYRLLSDQPLTPYLRATNQLDPAEPKPHFMYSRENDGESP